MTLTAIIVVAVGTALVLAAITLFFHATIFPMLEALDKIARAQEAGDREDDRQDREDELNLERGDRNDDHGQIGSVR